MQERISKISPFMRRVNRRLVGIYGKGVRAKVRSVSPARRGAGSVMNLWPEPRDKPFQLIEGTDIRSEIVKQFQIEAMVKQFEEEGIKLNAYQITDSVSGENLALVLTTHIADRMDQTAQDWMNIGGDIRSAMNQLSRQELPLRHLPLQQQCLLTHDERIDA